jgi:signal transduction histidine kinase
VNDMTGAGAAFRADPERLYLVIRDLVENGVKFSPEGSPVAVCVEATPDGLLFSVCDEGPVIAEDHAELVVERFYQVEGAEYHSTPGLGLGLYIAKTLVEGHGRWIKYRPGEDGGSIFEFFIPESPEQA